MRNLLIAIGGSVVFLIMLGGAFLFAMFGAYVAQLIWAWHVMPLATWVPAIGFKTFWALMAINAVLFVRPAPDVEEPKRTTTEKLARLGGLLLAPAFALLVAWVLK